MSKTEWRHFDENANSWTDSVNIITTEELWSLFEKFNAKKESEITHCCVCDIDVSSAYEMTKNGDTQIWNMCSGCRVDAEFWGWHCERIK